MEVKLVHPSDPEKKVITVTNEYQDAAYRSQGFVDEVDLTAGDDADSSSVSKQVDDLTAKLEVSRQKLATEKAARKEVEAQAEEAKKALDAAIADKEAALNTATEAEAAKVSAIKEAEEAKKGN